MISSRLLTLHRACALITLGIVLLWYPQHLFENSLVVVLGSLVQQTYPEDAGKFAPLVTGLLVVMGLQDLGLLLAENSVEAIHAAVQPRVIGFFVLAGLAYQRKSGFDLSVTFAYAFSELIINVWIYLASREEMNEQSRVKIRESRGQTAAGHDGLE